MIIHSSQQEVQTQARGRYRNDLDTLYLYEPTAKVSEQQLTIPRRYLGRRLSKTEIQRLIYILDIRDKKRELVKPPTFIKILQEVGYKVKKERSNRKRYIVITK